MKPTVPEVLPLVQALYARHSAGCCWHIVLDDGNVEDSSVAWVIKDWLPSKDPREHAECFALAEVLPKMSLTQRLKLGRMPKRGTGKP